MEKEANHTQPFLHVKIEKDNGQFLTSIYRKPTFTGQYIRWDSFGLSKRNTNLIGTLVRRALVICSKRKLQQELDSIRSILRQNGYLEVIINLTISKKIARFYQPVKEGPQKRPVYLKLPWIGNILLKFEKQVKSNVKLVFQQLNPAFFSKRARFCPQFTRIPCPPCNKAWSYTNTCAAVIVGMWVAHS